MAALAPLAGLAASAALFFVGQPPLIAIGAGLAVFAVVQVAIKKGRARGSGRRGAPFVLTRFQPCCTRASGATSR